MWFKLLLACPCRGFDADLIEEKCKDFYEHDLLSRVYRVKIKSAFLSTIEKQVREELVRRQDGPHERARPGSRSRPAT